MSPLRANALLLADEAGIAAREAFAADIEHLMSEIVARIRGGMTATQAATEVARQLGVIVPSRLPS